MSTRKMRAVIMMGRGEPDVLVTADVPAPVPGRGEILVKVAASGVNRADLLQRRGRYPVPAGYPENILGLEYSGIVAETGADVTAWSPGDPVMGITGGGGYAQYVVVHEREAVPVPPEMDVVQAGALPEAFLTAFDALVGQMRIQAGESLLIHAAGSGVGTAAVQLGRWAGARTFGTSRTVEKLRRARELGLEHGISAAGEEGWSDALLDLTGGRGVDLILDLVGGPYLADNVRSLATGGRIITVGVTGGREAELDLRALMGKRGSITGTVLRARPLEDKATLAQHFRRVALPAVADGRLRPVVDTLLTPEQAPEAHRRMEANLNFGKLLIVW
ncbi:MAG TPA: NAD(P)H-quinone oxidoreductase [Longimicrobiales bacterium]|nr:NAD(P)H-quinone oxidoreductase [Longimicrobiales bacterium]